MKKRMLPILAMVVLLCVAFGACSKGKTTEIVTEGETTILQNVGGKPADYGAKEVAYAAAGYLEQAKTYRVDTEGSTKAKKGMISYTQNIENFALKNVDEAFAQSVSSSTFANVAHQAFVKDGVEKVVYRNAQSGDMSVQTADEYRNLYGVIPGIDNLGGWVLNDETILYAQRVEEESSADHNVYHYVLDKKAATGRMSVQMKKFGGLKDYPSFESVELTLVVKDNFQPVSLSSTAKYGISIAVLGNMNCTQTLTASYAEFADAQNIPDAEAFNAAVGKDPTHEIPVPPVSDTALEGLVGSLVEYDVTNGVALRGSTALNVGGTELSVPLEGAMKFDLSTFDPADFAKSLRLSVSTQIAGMPLALHSLGDGKLYIDLGSTKSVFDLAELGLSFDPSELDFGSFVSVTKTDAGYRVAPSELLLGMLDPMLEGLGFRLDRAEILFAVSGGRTSSIELGLTLCDTAGNTVFALGADMMLNDKVYAAPDTAVYEARSLSQLIGNVLPILNVAEGFASYDWAQGKTFHAEIGVNLSLFQDMRIPVTADIRFNPDAKTLAEAINFRVAIELSGDTLQAVFSLAGMVGMSIFPTDVNHIELYYTGDGNLYTVLGYRGTAADGTLQKSDLILSEIAIGDQVGALLGNLVLGASLEGGTQLDAAALAMNLLFSFQPSVGQNETILSANKELLAIVNAGYASLLKTLGDAAGELGSLLPWILGATFHQFDLRFATDANGAFAGISIVLNADKNPDSYTFRFDLKPGDDVADGTFEGYAAHISQLQADTEAASELNAYLDGLSYTAENGVYTFESVSLYDSVGAELDALVKGYAALTIEQRVMVYRYDVLLAYRAQYDALRAEAQTFADTVLGIGSGFDGWTELNAAYDALTADQLDYLGYLVEHYLALRADYESAYGVAAINHAIDELASAIESAATLETLSAHKAALTAIRADVAALLPQSQETVRDLSVVESAIDAKTVAILNDEFPTVTAAIQAVDETTTDEQLAEIEAQAKALNEAYNQLFDAENKTLVTAYADFAKVYPSVVNQWNGRFDALDFEAQYAALIESNKNKTAVADIDAYYTALVTLNNKFNRLTDDQKELVVSRAAATTDCDGKMAAALNGAFPGYVNQMQGLIDGSLTLTDEEAEALDAAVVLARNAYSKFFDSTVKATVKENYDACYAIYYDFRDAVYLLRMPDFLATFAELKTQHEDATSLQDVKTYFDALGELDFEASRYDKEAIKSYYEEVETVKARLIDALNAELLALTNDMNAAVAAPTAPDADTLAALSERAAFVASLVLLTSDDALDLELRPSFVGVDAFLTVYRGAYRALVNTIA